MQSEVRKLSFFRRVLAIILACAFVYSPAGQAKIDAVFPSSNFFTLNPRIKTTGAVYSGDSEAYVKEVFRRLVFQADLIARDAFYNAEESQLGYNYTYYTFLILALSVPYHESRLNHLRITSGDKCVKTVNNLSNFKSSEQVQKIFKQILKNYNPDPIVPDCQFIEKTETVTQALVSVTNDIGMMQINVRFHPTALRPEIYLNLDSFIGYGLKYLFDGNGHRGFVDIRDISNKGSYPCLWPNGRLDHSNLIRGTWARYNSGSDICRFANPKSEHALKDKGFAGSLEQITKLNGDATFYHQYLTPGSLERAAFDEMTANFRNIGKKKPEQNSALNKLLAEEGERFKSKDAESFRHDYYTTHKLSATRINARLRPGLKTEICGVIGRSGVNEYVVVKRRIGVVDGIEWVEVEPPLKDSFIQVQNNIAACKGKRSFYIAQNLIEPVSDMDGPQAWVGSQPVVVYSGTTEFSEQLHVLDPHQPVQILEQQFVPIDTVMDSVTELWIKVQVNKKISGWVKGSDLNAQ